jgi:outer membrane biosynthesis protein TonB
MEALLMKALGIVSTAALLLLFGASVPAFAQDEHHDQEAKPAKQEQAKPAQHEEQAKPATEEKQPKPAKQQEQPKTAKQAQPDKPAKQENQAKTAKQTQPDKPAKQENQAKTEKQAQPAKPAKEEKQTKPAKQENQAKTEKPPQENKQTAQEGNSNSAPQHTQRTAAEQKRQAAVPALRLSAGGQGRIPDDRFRASFGEGHTFSIGSPRVVDGYSRFQYGGFWFGFVQPWPDGWYYTDNVYVDYIDGGYYLYNPYYPGVRMSICVVL